MIVALLLAMASPSGDAFDAMTDDQREVVHKVCESSLDAYMRGDKTFLQRTFKEANTPVSVQLTITKLCVTYSEGVKKGLSLAKDN